MEQLHVGNCTRGKRYTSAGRIETDTMNVLRHGEWCYLRCSPMRDPYDPSAPYRAVSLRVMCEDGNLIGPALNTQCSTL